MSQDIIVVAGLFAVLAGIWVVNMVSRKIEWDVYRQC